MIHVMGFRRQAVGCTLCQTKGDYRVTRALRSHHLYPLSRSYVDGITGDGTSINILYTHRDRASMGFRAPVSTWNHEKEKSAWVSLVGVSGWVVKWESNKRRGGGNYRILWAYLPFGQHKSPEAECSLEVINFYLVDTIISFIDLGLV